MGAQTKRQRIDLAINDFIENPCMKTMILTKPKMAMHETIGICIGARIPVAEIIGKHISPEIKRGCSVRWRVFRVFKFI